VDRGSDPAPPDDDTARMGFLTGQGAVPGVLRDVAALLKARGCARGVIEDGVIVLAEVLNNVEEHAYGGRAGEPVNLELAMSSSALAVVVRDRGAALPDGRLPGDRMPLCEGLPPEHWPEGGFGWAIVRRLVRDIRYDREEGGNVLSFTVGHHPDAA
jgi:serine/threonine-protein kinase RsbW